MATIEKYSETSYRITISCGYDKNGKQIRKRKTLTLPNGLTQKQQQKEVQKQSVLFEKEVHNGTYLDGETITFKEFSEKWLCDYAEKELAPKTVLRYKQLLIRINESLGGMKLCKIQPPHIMSFINNLAESGIRADNKYIMKEEFTSHFKENKKELSKAGLNPKTVTNILKGGATDKKSACKIANILERDILSLFTPQVTNDKLSSQTLLHHFRLLNTILNSAVQWNLLLYNPAERVKSPRVERDEIQSLNDDEVMEMLILLENEPPKYQAAVYVAVFGGLRLGEVIALKWADVDFQSGKLSITKAGQYITGMGNFEKSPKNKSSKRELKLPDIALQKLRAWKKKQNMERFKAGSEWNDGDNIFTQWNGTPVFYNSISQWFKKWLSNTELPQITFHGLRHSCASMLIAHGTDIATVSKRLGHSRTSTTSDIYTHAISKMDVGAANTLDNLFSPITKASAQ